MRQHNNNNSNNSYNNNNYNTTATTSHINNNSPSIVNQLDIKQNTSKESDTNLCAYLRHVNDVFFFYFLLFFWVLDKVEEDEAKERGRPKQKECLEKRLAHVS